MAQDQNVRFVRINGRIVPIKQKGPGEAPPSKQGSRAKNMPSTTRLANQKERNTHRAAMGFFGAMFGGAAGAITGGATGLGAKFLGSKVKKLGVLAKASGSKGALIGAAAGGLGLGAAMAKESSAPGTELRVKNEAWVKERRKAGLPAGQRAWEIESSKEWQSQQRKRG